MALHDTRIEYIGYASCGVGGHFRVVTSMPHVTYYLKFNI